MKDNQIKALLIASAFGLASSQALADYSTGKVKEDYHPLINGSPVTLMLDNMVTQKLGGRVVNLDLWAGEFLKTDDNIFGSQHDRDNDTIFTTAAGLFLQAAERNLWSTRVEAQFEHNNYIDHGEYDSNEGFFHAEGSYIFSPALTARATFKYDRVYDNVREKRDIYSLDNYTAGAGVTLKPSPYFSVDGDYRFFALRRGPDVLSWQEYNENAVSVRPSYAITPNTRIYGQLSFTRADMCINHYNDTDAFEVKVGVSWRYFSDMSLYGEFGLNTMNFGTNGDLADRRGEHVTRPNARVGGQVYFNADTRLKAQVEYISGVAAMTTSAYNSAYIDSFRVNTELMYSPGAGRFTARFTPYYSNNKPSNNTRYQEYGLGLGLTYSIKDWLNVSGGYRYSKVKYSHEAGSYDRNSFTLGAALTF